MKYAAPLCLIAAITILSGCSSLKVSSEQTAGFDYGSIQTYEWIQAPKKILNEDDTYLNDHVHAALNQQFVERGWQQVEVSDKADIQIVYYIKLAEHEEYTTPVSSDESQVTGGFTYNNDKGSWGYNDHAPDINVYTIEVGTLSLLLYNAETGEKIWTGTLQTRLDRTTPLDKQPRKIRRISNKIIDRIPKK